MDETGGKIISWDRRRQGTGRGGFRGMRASDRRMIEIRRRRAWPTTGRADTSSRAYVFDDYMTFIRPRFGRRTSFLLQPARYATWLDVWTV